MFVKRRYIYPLITITVTLFFIFFNNYLNPPENSVSLKSGWTVEYNNKVKNIDNVPFYTAGDNDDDFVTGIYSFKCTFNLDEEIKILCFVPLSQATG